MMWGGGYDMMWGDGYGGWAWMGLVHGVLWWALLILGIVVLVRVIRRPGSAGGGAESALDILKKRYARGEIEREEFEQRKRDLAA